MQAHFQVKVLSLLKKINRTGVTGKEEKEIVSKDFIDRNKIFSYDLRIPLNLKHFRVIGTFLCVVTMIYDHISLTFIIVYNKITSFEIFEQRQIHFFQ